MTSKEVIRHLEMQAHPEGGYFAEFYRSELEIAGDCLPPIYAGRRSAATSIFYLLEQSQVSLLHRLHSDELWFYSSGTPLHLSILHPDGRLQTVILGPHLNQGAALQALVPAGAWMAASLEGKKDDYSLLICSVVPGFDFRDFEMAGRENMLRDFPQHRDFILRFTASA